MPKCNDACATCHWNFQKDTACATLAYPPQQGKCPGFLPQPKGMA